MSGTIIEIEGVESEKPVSRYKIESLPDGFIISSPDRVATEVRIAEDGVGFSVNDSGKSYSRNKISTCSFIEGHKLTQYTSNNLMRGWVGDPTKTINKSGNPPKKLKEWAVGRTSRALGKKIRAERLRLIEKADPTIVAAQKSVFSAAGKVSSLVTDPNFFSRPSNHYYIKDIINYRAAALASFSRSDYYHRGHDDWKLCFTCEKNGGLYSSLTKTLMKLPGGIPVSVLAAFKNTKLKRPVYSRRELLFILTCANNYNYLDNGINDSIDHIIQHASAEEITRAAKVLEGHLGGPIVLRKTAGIYQLSDYLMDAAPYLEHNGNVVGLTEKAIRWHRERDWNKATSGFPPETPMATPPIPLPTDPYVTFLSTAQEVAIEGSEQGHCVATYIPKAKNGNCYLFSIKYKGTRATAELSNRGNILQIRGPHNSMNNEAITYGKKVLGKWGKEIGKQIEEGKLGEPEIGINDDWLF